MRKLFKFLFTLFVIILLLIVVPIVILYFTIADKTDNAPVDLYNENITLDSEIAKVLDQSLVASDTMNLVVSEDDLNLIIFSIIRKNINQSFYNSQCSTDTCKYIKTIDLDSSIPIIGGKKVYVKNIYSKIEDDTLKIIATVDAAGIKTNLNIAIKLIEEDETYKLTVTKLGLGKLNILSGIGKLILKPVLTTLNFSEEDINQKINEKNIPVNFDINSFTFTFDKSNIGTIIDSFGENENSLQYDLVNLLTDSLSIGIFQVDNKNYFGAKLNIGDLKYNPTNDGVAPYSINYELYKTRMSTMLSDNLQTNEIISKYILYGYSPLTIEEKLIIDNIDFTPIAITNRVDYTGLVSTFDTNLENYITNQLYAELSNLSDEKVSIKIEESELNKVFSSKELIGNGLYKFYKINEENKYFYSGVEALWVDIENNQLGLKIIYNLNGNKLCLFSAFNNSTPNSANIEADFDELRIGSKELGDNVKDNLLNLIKDITLESMQFITIEDNKIIINSNEFLDSINATGSLNDLLTIVKNENMLILNLDGINIDANGEIEFTLDLEKISNEVDYSSDIEEISTGFNTETFIENKVQTLIINNLSNEEKKIIFTQEEFSKLIFQQTNSYQDFKNTTLLGDNLTNFTFQTKGIIIEMHEANVVMKFVVDINGLESVMIINGTIQNIGEDQVNITLADTLNLSEINTSSDFLFDILGNNMNNFGIMSYNSQTKTFSLSSTAFEEFMAIGGESTPLAVESIRVIEGAIEVVVNYTDPTIDTMIDTVTSVFEDVLQDDFLDQNQFNTTDTDQQTAVQELTNTLEDIQTILNDPSQELSEDLTDDLINNINQLSEENQQVLLEQIETQSNSQDLLDLYNTLFGN